MGGCFNLTGGAVNRLVEHLHGPKVQGLGLSGLPITNKTLRLLCPTYTSLRRLFIGYSTVGCRECSRR